MDPNWLRFWLYVTSFLHRILDKGNGRFLLPSQIEPSQESHLTALMTDFAKIGSVSQSGNCVSLEYGLTGALLPQKSIHKTILYFACIFLFFIQQLFVNVGYDLINADFSQTNDLKEFTEHCKVLLFTHWLGLSDFSSYK